jgi:uncharacterized repeat protein (TIGR01451 family)
MLWKAVSAGAVGLLVVSGAGVSLPAQARPPQFSITKERTGPNPIVAGSLAGTTFRVTVRNDEEQEIQIGFDDVLDPGLVVQGNPVSSVPGATCTSVQGSAFSCWSMVPALESWTVDVTVTAPSWLPAGTYTNCAQIGFGKVDPDNGVDTCGLVKSGNAEPAMVDIFVARATVDVVTDADMSIAASHAAQFDQVDPGNQAVVDFAVKNNGPSDAASPITVKGTLPAGVTFVSGTDPWTCSAAGQAVECSWTPAYTKVGVSVPAPVSSLPPGESAPPLSWTVATAKPGLVASYPVSATVASGTPDSKPANNTSTTPIGVTPVDLALAKSGSGSFTLGEQGVWTLSASNVGAIDDAGLMTVVDTLPAGSSFVSSSGEGWSCSASGQTVTFTHAGLAKGASSQVSLTTQIDKVGVTNEATVSTTSYEKDLANNSASATVKVRRLPQTAKALPASPTRVKAGRTDQGQKLKTRVICRPKKSAAAGEVSFCKVTRKAGVVRIKVKGPRTMKVTVIQTAKGTPRYKRFVQRKTWVVKP